MSVRISSFSSLPTPLKAGVILVSGGGIVAASMYALQELPYWVRWALVGGIATVGLLLVMYAGLLRWLNKRKSRPMEQQVLSSTSSGPQSMSDPERIAQVDDLRRKFEEGIATFKAAGKSLYSLPWYMILGESGSGKTEAIRHCGIGFPPGLHDQCQGVGGTINMNWWFTDHGVFLDTAGRMIFKEAQAGRTSEWKEFLRLLKKSRRNCPINGAFLVIPADSLITDSTEEIEQKASQIALQFDVIQRQLDVRFPVYVIVSKSDLINGFREFFDSIDNPQLQHQIVGWSNPGELDEPYDSRFVDTYLQKTQARLYRYRLTRLQALQADEGDEAKPAIDALYAFPHGLAQIVPRLRRYLDLVFQVGSQWSCKPLFFRGIYFTSSMQEGVALDEDLAQFLGIPVDSLPEGPIWRRDRAYFLRDLFVKKAFQEKGLVTQATSARKQHTRRKTILLACGLASVLILIGLTAFLGKRYVERIGKIQQYLAPAVHASEVLSIIQPDTESNKVHYAGDQGITYTHNGREQGLGQLMVHEYYSELADLVFIWDEKLGIGRSELVLALDNIYRKGVTNPIAEAWINRKADMVWTRGESQTKALVHAISLRSQQTLPATQKVGSLLDPFMDCVFRRDQSALDRYRQHKGKLHDPLGKLHTWYNDKQDPNGMWPFAAHLLDSGIEQGIKDFNRYWAQTQDPGPGQPGMSSQRLKRVMDALGKFDTFEEQIRSKYKGVVTATQWDDDFKTLKQMQQEILDCTGDFNKHPSLYDAWRDHLERVDNNYQYLLETFNQDVNDPELSEWHAQLNSQWMELRKRIDDTELQSMDKLWIRVDEERPSEILVAVYEIVARPLGENTQSIDFAHTHISDAWTQADEVVRKARQEIQKRDELGNQRVDKACATVDRLLAQREFDFRYGIAEQWLSFAQDELDSLSDCKDVDPDRIKALFSGRMYLTEFVKDLSAPQDPQDLKDQLDKIVQGEPKLAECCLAYWLGSEFDQQVEDIAATHAIWEGNWAGQRNRLKYLDVGSVLSSLRQAVEELIEKTDDFDKSEQCHKTITQLKKNLAGADRDLYYLEEICHKMWGGLSDDPLAARETLLKLDVNAFRHDYFKTILDDEARVGPRLMDRFWYRLSCRTLELLAKDAAVALENAVEAVTQEYLNRFPLTKSSEEPLELAEYTQLRRLLARSTPDRAPNTIGDGQNTENPDIDIYLEQLRAPADYPDQLKSAMEALPPLLAKGRYWCKVIIVKPNTVNEITIKKGREDPLKWNNLMEANEIKVPYDCSHDDITLNFYAFRDRPDSLLLAVPPFETLWPWHEMLRKFGADRDDANLLRIDVEVRTSTGPEIRTVELRLEFYRDETLESRIDVWGKG